MRPVEGSTNPSAEHTDSGAAEWTGPGGGVSTKKPDEGGSDSQTLDRQKEGETVRRGGGGGCQVNQVRGAQNVRCTDHCRCR